MINVKSEYGKLKKVLLHRPGRETSNITPSTMEELLFEDPYYLKEAQREHDIFADTMRNAGVEVVYLEDLLSEVFDSSEELRKQFLYEFIREANISQESGLFVRTMTFLEGISNNKELVLKLMEGVRYSELPEPVEGKMSLIEFSISDIWALEPLPNLIFTRDNFASIGNGISLHSMKKPTRRRETLIASYIFNYHPEYKETPRYYEREERFSLEGGDVMILSDKEIAVGISERTDADGIEKLAKHIFADSETTIETVYAINIPKGRAWMHLDTVFTQIDKDKFAIFSNYKFDIFKLTNDNGDLHIEKITKKIDEFLAEVFDVEKVHLIQCGGGDPLYSEREQWNDGSNVLAIAPNEIIVYDRNDVTNQKLREAGVIIHEIPSYELSRGRGGPRCMSMPLEREEV